MHPSALRQIQRELAARIPPQQTCQPTALGEYWFDEKMEEYLKDCGAGCANMSILPLFDASLPLHSSHHGTFGRGVIDGNIDCTHYCHNIMDQWATFLYNALVPVDESLIAQA